MILPGLGYCKEPTIAKGQDGSKACFYSQCHSNGFCFFQSDVITLPGSELASRGTQSPDFLILFPYGLSDLTFSSLELKPCHIFYWRLPM